MGSRLTVPNSIANVETSIKQLSFINQVTQSVTTLKTNKLILDKQK